MQSNAAQQEEMFDECEWFDTELSLLEPEEDISTAEYAERYLHVIKSPKPGPWRNENNPPLVGIMNVADRKGNFKNTRTLVLLKGVQTGGTDAAHNVSLKRMDKSAQNAFIVMETDKKAKRMMNQRYQQRLKKSSRLVEQMSDNPDDFSNYSIVMNTGFCLNIGWAGSHSAVSSDASETVILDELDKYAKPMNIEEAKDRTTTFVRTGFNFILSTPGEENGPITVEFEGCDTAMDYQVECPDCGELQVMAFENFTWPGKDEELKSNRERMRLANKVLREGSARYACKGCGVLWDDHMRDKAVRLGLKHGFHGWKMREDIDLPVSIGFHLPSWISPFKSLSHVVARWLKAQASDQPGKLRAWHNQEAAEPFIEKHSQRKVDTILDLRDDRPRGRVPKDISCLLLIVDTQQRGFFYEVRAFGWGPDLEPWQVREGYVESFKALEDVLYNSEYKDVDGKDYAIQGGFIDSGGGTGTVPNHSRTAEVYDFCRRNSIMRPLKGRQTMTSTYSTTHLDYYPGTNKKARKRIPGGLTLYHLNVTYFKDYLNNKLAINPDDPGAWHLHSECPVGYAQQMVAEYKDEKARWQCPRGRPNHYWDTGVYSLAAAEILQIKFWKKPNDETPRARRRTISKGVN